MVEMSASSKVKNIRIPVDRIPHDSLAVNGVFCAILTLYVEGISTLELL